MFEEYSAGYMLGQVTLREYNGQRPVLAAPEYERVQSEVYEDVGEDCTTLERYGWPLLLKINQRVVPVYGEAGMPAETVAVPDAVADRLDVSGVSREDVFLAKGQHAEQLLSMVIFE